MKVVSTAGDFVALSAVLDYATLVELALGLI
jgi:hypothetical protein